MRGLIRLSYFIWVVVPLAFYGAYVVWGTPHVIGEYEFLNNGSLYDANRSRIYTSCTFWGVTGMHKIPASNGRCGYVAFFKTEAD